MPLYHQVLFTDFHCVLCIVTLMIIKLFRQQTQKYQEIIQLTSTGNVFIQRCLHATHLFTQYKQQLPVVKYINLKIEKWKIKILLEFITYKLVRGIEDKKPNKLEYFNVH